MTLSENVKTAGPRLTHSYIAAVALMFVINAMAERFWGTGPPVFGLLLCGWYVITARQIPPLPKYMTVITAAIAVFTAASLLWTQYPESGLDRISCLLPLMLGGYLLVLLAGVSIYDGRRGFYVLYAAFATGLVLILVNLYGGMLLHNILHGNPPDQWTDLHHTNRAICASVLLIWPLVALQGRHGILRERYAVILGILFFLCLVRTDSQSAQLAFILAAGIFIIHRKCPPKWLGAFFMVVALYAVTLPWTAQSAYHFILQSETAQTLPGYPVERLEILSKVGDKTSERPFSGHGIEATRNIVFDGPVIVRDDNKALHPHNMTAQIWIEFGAAGIVLYLALLAVFLKSLLRWPSWLQPYALASFAAFFSIGNTGYGLWQSWWIGLVFFTVSLFFWIRANEKDRTPAAPSY